MENIDNEKHTSRMLNNVKRLYCRHNWTYAFNSSQMPFNKLGPTCYQCEKCGAMLLLPLDEDSRSL